MRRPWTRVVLVLVGVVAIGAAAMVHADTRSTGDAVGDHAAALGPFDSVHCDIRGTTAYAGRDGLALHDCWMSRDDHLGADDEYACFVEVGDRVIDVTDEVGGRPDPPGCRSAPPPAAEVSRVVGGDTLVLDDGARLRVALVDAPGIAGNPCYGLMAREVLRRLLPEGTPVGLRRAPPRTQGRGETRVPAARVFRRGTDIGLELVRRGAAAPWLAPRAAGEPARRLLRAAREARARRRGLWSTCPATRLAPARPLATRRPAGLWIPVRALRRLPTTGRGWAELKAAANELGRPDAWKLARPDVADLDSSHDVFTYAAALVAARTGDAGMRAKVVTALREAMNSGRPSQFGALARGRNAPAYVFAADLVSLRRLDPALDGRFRRWLRAILHHEYRDGSIVSNHDRHPNNHGTMTGGGRAAIATYLGDAEELARTARVFRAWIGEGGGYEGLRFGRSRSWQGDPARPVGINRKGARRRSIDVDGALPDEMRRGCELRAPPCYSHYPWEGIGGALMQAELLHRQGYDTYAWGDRALLRAARFLFGLGRRDPRFTEGVLGGPHSWEPWLLNRRYGTDLPTGGPTDRGKNMGWTDWTHAPTR